MLDTDEFAATRRKAVKHQRMKGLGVNARRQHRIVARLLERWIRGARSEDEPLRRPTYGAAGKPHSTTHHRQRDRRGVVSAEMSQQGCDLRAVERDCFTADSKADATVRIQDGRELLDKLRRDLYGDSRPVKLGAERVQRGRYDNCSARAIERHSCTELR
jgi:hypothetical protein